MSLFSVSRAFFAQSQAHKSEFRVLVGNSQGSEEGWSRIVGEKELLTIRRGGSTCPPSVEDEARTLWRECGALMQEMTRGVEKSLGMHAAALDGVVSAECVMPEGGSDRLETLLRMFRYERRSERADPDPAAPADSGKGRLVAEPHLDLGLLSLVIGASPGLEVWHPMERAWIPIEEPPHAGPGLTATLLVGETLTRLTNARYVPGRHRVFVPSAPIGDDSEDDSQFRYSLVFALRPHISAIISTSTLTTPLTGAFAYPIEGVRARDLFAAIAGSHWNVNTGHKMREAQRMQMRGSATTKASTGNERREADSGQEMVGGVECRGGKDKRKRWSLPIFRSSHPPTDIEPRVRRSRWSVFQRISGS